MKKSNPTWVLYILQCADGTLYTGVTNNLKKRLAAHASGKGAKYTRGRSPLKLVYNKSYKTRSAAQVAEVKTKALSRAEKLEIIKTYLA